MSQPSDAVLLNAMREVTAPIAESLQLPTEMFELWYYKVYSALDLLTTNRFRAEDTRLYQRATAYATVIHKLIAHPEIRAILSKSELAALNAGLEDILGDVNEALNSSVSPAEISLFCQVAASGRAFFASKCIDPDSFTEETIFTLAHMIRDNYGAYEDTLRGLKV
jgi:hypothetical protein